MHLQRLFVFIWSVVLVSNVMGQETGSNVQELLEHIEDLSQKNLELAIEIDEAKVSISELLVHMDELSLQFLEATIGKDDLTSVIAELELKIKSIKPGSDTVYVNDTEVIIQHEEKVDALKNQISTLESTISRLNSKVLRIGIEKDSINSLLVEERAINEQLESDVKELNGKNQRLEQEVDDLESKLNCVRSFANQQRSSKLESEINLSIARAKYDKIYPLYKRKNFRGNIDTLVNEVVDIYRANQTSYQTMKCESVPELEYSSDNLKAIDDFYLMRIYAFNEGDVIDKINDDGDDDGRQKSVSLALTHLGKIMDKGHYDDKQLPDVVIQELLEVLSNLDFYIIPSKTKNSDLYELKKIITYYEKEQFDSALSQYNKYRRYITTERVSKEEELINEIEFKIASILTWQLAYVSRDNSVYPKSSWLREVSASPLSTGLDMVRVLLLRKNLDDIIRRNCIITKMKMYVKD